MERNFETEVLTRLAVIESKLDGYQQMKEHAEEAHILANNNRRDIDDIQDKLKWITRSIVGAIIAGAVGIIFILIQTGAGLN